MSDQCSSLSSSFSNCCATAKLNLIGSGEKSAICEDFSVSIVAALATMHSKIDMISCSILFWLCIVTVDTGSIGLVRYTLRERIHGVLGAQRIGLLQVGEPLRHHLLQRMIE